jgi:hypothetical protein
MKKLLTIFLLIIFSCQAQPTNKKYKLKIIKFAQQNV